MFSLGLMTLALLILILSCLGWPLFVYELFRHHLGFRYHPSGALAFLSTAIALGVAQMIAADPHTSDPHRAFRAAFVGVWIYSPFVLWLILRIRRSRAVRGEHTKT